MPELIERGYIYIGLPPRTRSPRVSRSPTSRTMPLWRSSCSASAIDGAALVTGEGVPPITGIGLEQLMQRYSNVLGHLKRLKHGVSTAACWEATDRAAASLNDALDQREALETLARGLEQRLSGSRLDSPRYQVSVIDDSLPAGAEGDAPPGALRAERRASAPWIEQPHAADAQLLRRLRLHAAGRSGAAAGRLAELWFGHFQGRKVQANQQVQRGLRGGWMEQVEAQPEKSVASRASAKSIPTSCGKPRSTRKPGACSKSASKTPSPPIRCSPC